MKKILLTIIFTLTLFFLGLLVIGEDIILAQKTLGTNVFAGVVFFSVLINIAINQIQIMFIKE